MARRRSGFVAGVGRVLRWALRLVLLLLVADLLYLAMVWPDWKALAAGPVPKSNFMRLYEAKAAERDWPPLAWQPVALERIPAHMQRAVIVAEDSRFYTHSGFDLVAIREAIDHNLARGELALGASTITQQTVKNLYLSPSRSPLRKWHELFYTAGIEQNLPKRRILELYLNVAEFGRGVYGVQAAARHYYGVDVERLTPVQSAELAATLPSPIKRNPANRTELFQRRTQRILELMALNPAIRQAIDEHFATTAVADPGAAEGLSAADPAEDPPQAQEALYPVPPPAEPLTL